MRGHDARQAALFSDLSSEQRVPATHPLRPLREYVDTALAALSPRLEALYARPGRPSIAPEKLLWRCCCRCATVSAASGC